MPNDPAAIEVRDLVKRYAKANFNAVDGVTFSVRPGEIFGLLGPNGAGKTTTIGVLITSVLPTSGSAAIMGLDVAADPIGIKQRIAVVPQQSNLDRSLRVREILTFHAAYHGVPHREREERADTLLDELGLGDRKNDRVARYSGGMSQRLMIARALMHAPDVLFLDEPTNNLDPQSRLFLWDRIRALNAQGIAVLSPDYLAAAFTQPEWASAFAKDPTGQDRKLVPVRVRECRPKGLLATLVYIDLVGQKEAVARKALLDGVGRGTRAPSATMGPQADRPRFPGGLPAIWNVPDLRNPNFTGREQLLQELRASLSSGLAAAIVPIAGLGGAGKTQLALEYAYRHTADYDIVWWVRAEDTATLTADYAALANHLGLPEKDLADQQAAAVAVRSWLGHNPGWLLILDNAHSAADCRDYLPMGAAGHVLITSRDPNWGAIAKPLRLPVLARMEGVEFLQKRCGRDEPAAAGELCEALGDLPLALEHAGAYIEATGGSIAKYLGLYRSRPREVLTDAVGATWEIALKRLQTQAPLALNLLYLVAFLAPDDIDPKLVAPAFPDATRFGEARAALLQYSLIDVSGGGIAAHRLVQATTRDQIGRASC